MLPNLGLRAGVDAVYQDRVLGSSKSNTKMIGLPEERVVNFPGHAETMADIYKGQLDLA